MLLTTVVVSKIFPNLNVVAHLVIPVGWGSCLLRLAIFCIHMFFTYFWVNYNIVKLQTCSLLHS